MVLNVMETMMNGRRRLMMWFIFLLQLLMMFTECSSARRQLGSFLLISLLFLYKARATDKSIGASTENARRISRSDTIDQSSYPPVQLQIYDDQVEVDNGIFIVTFSIPEGMVIGLNYNGIDNLLEAENEVSNRGYWDVVWTDAAHPGDNYDKLEGTDFNVIMEQEDQVEISFTRIWDPFGNNTGLSLNIDKRFIIQRGYSGFYSYGILERLEGWPDIDIYQGRIVFKLKESLFTYMAISDEKQRIMPTAQDRERGEPLDYPEAVLLTNPSNPLLIGEVDDKYQYSTENKENRVHGWICSIPPVGFWMITPSNEFRTGGPIKQDLTSHVGPVTLSMFFSTHYAGENMGLKFQNGEPWKKVFGPVSIYLNSVPADENPLTLWPDAKEQMLIETESWPYDFPQSEDYPSSDERGMISGRLLVSDRYISKELITANSAFIGLAPPGEVGSWQEENRGYQFWTQSDVEGYFTIKGVRPGNYSLNAFVPGFIGDYMYESFINIQAGSRIRMGVLIYDAPRNGPTLWQIGIPDRTAAEFFIPDPNPTLLNELYVAQISEKYRQYGLWERYTDLYPDHDLVYTIGSSDYETDWFFAQVTRNIGNKTYIPTTWEIVFDVDQVNVAGNYTLQIALASATTAELQVWINNPEFTSPYVTTGLIGKDNAIARHGIHGLYWLYSVGIPGSMLQLGQNTIFLTQAIGGRPFRGIMYDYIRLELPPDSESN